MNLTLFYTPIACSLVPLISLHESGADFAVKPVNILKGEQMTPEYLRMNPKHKVPVLLVDGKPLTENVAIALWMTRAFPKAGILPTDSDAEVSAISIMAWCASGIHPNLTRIFRPRNICETPGSEDSITHLATKELDYAFGIANNMLADRDYFFGTWCAADSHFFWAWRRAITLGVDFPKYRNCAAHSERMQQRPAVKAALDYEKQVLKEFGKGA